MRPTGTTLQKVQRPFQHDARYADLALAAICSPVSAAAAACCIISALQMLQCTVIAHACLTSQIPLCSVSTLESSREAIPVSLVRLTACTCSCSAQTWLE